MRDQQLYSADRHSSDYHKPVLFQEVIEALRIKADGVYIDCTFGGGGHSRGILEKLNEDGRLIAFDQDADATENLFEDSRVIFVHNNFCHLQRFLRLHGFQQVDGILADLGVSSRQFDNADRGFSTRFEGPLDMRMDQRQAITAADILKTYDEHQLQKLFEQFGEVTNAKTLARTIVEGRTGLQLQTTQQLKNLIRPIVKGNPNKYWAQVFQALRIEVNGEVKALREMLEQVPAILKKGGRVAIIAFHSIEDRIVKGFFKGAFEFEDPFSVNAEERRLTVITKKPITAGLDEFKQNPRSRSAKLRVAEMI